MLKKTALVLSLSCAVALANENGFFAGASVGYSLGTISDERMLFGGLVEGADNDKNINGYNLGIKAGYEWFYSQAISFRPYIDYTYSGYGGSGNITKDFRANLLTINADVNYYLTQDFSIFAGLSLGEVFAQTSGEYGNENAFGWGGELGWTYKVLSYLELEGKYKYFDSSLPEKMFANNTRKIQPDDMHLFSIGLNYRF